MVTRVPHLDVDRSWETILSKNVSSAISEVHPARVGEARPGGRSLRVATVGAGWAAGSENWGPAGAREAAEKRSSRRAEERA
jgi:hypothetical protein